MQTEDKKHGDQNIDHILKDSHPHRDTGGLHAHRPACQPIDAQHCGGTPHHNFEIGGHKRPDSF